MCNSLNLKALRAGTRGVHSECCSLAGKGILQGVAGGAIPVCELVLTRGGGLCYGQRVTIHSAP